MPLSTDLAFPLVPNVVECVSPQRRLPVVSSMLLKSPFCHPGNEVMHEHVIGIILI